MVIICRRTQPQPPTTLTAHTNDDGNDMARPRHQPQQLNELMTGHGEDNVGRRSDSDDACRHHCLVFQLRLSDSPPLSFVYIRCRDHVAIGDVQLELMATNDAGKRRARATAPITTAHNTNPDELKPVASPHQPHQPCTNPILTLTLR
ncbi:uncharacterized protein LACBIDRAFT_323405 [Laccaria bicolor S238N-H82]|uniref:Predicted protein n=1 Tax=Laccaria bicolor (strain S238N-H82 / ATCC MYA-4686) TaxID=486041 RepID=B0CXI1_LACBS|nr:uncharacterized protein LACBIDRAFT_323405 [Laccaria bicolor S238N-H82]EDR12728.1 predicted protein [Laccaria bicolor S238N-H82]|eukprot:XP_001876992.1 predicted protein [Laccaria bicolor S238N-H82]